MSALPVPPFPGGPHAITADDVCSDRAARTFLRLIDRHPAAFAALVAVLNRPEVEQQLTRRSHREPALAAAVNEIEADPRIVAVLDDPDDGRRFRQLVGVVVKVKMAALGWTQRHQQQAMGRYSERFGTAETYEPPFDEDAPPGSPRAVLAALEELKQIGTPEEQERDRAELMAALAATRAAEGRPF